MNVATETYTLRGHLRVRAHPPEYAYRRGDYRSGGLVFDRPNTIIAAGRDYLAALLIADGVNRAFAVGLTQIGLYTSGGVERLKADLTDRYAVGSTAYAVLYIPSVQPAGQPYTFTEARLFANSGGSVYVAQRTGLSVAKNSGLALTVEWTLTLT